jgi:hypothetical protein
LSMPTEFLEIYAALRYDLLQAFDLLKDVNRIFHSQIDAQFRDNFYRKSFVLNQSQLSLSNRIRL